MSNYTDRTIQKLEEYEAALKCAIREAVVAVRGSQEFHDAVEDLLKGTPYGKPIGDDYEGLYGRVRSAINDGIRLQKRCDCIASGNVSKPKQHGADLHAKDCAVYR